MEKELLDVLACPACRGELKRGPGQAENVYCVFCGRVYPAGGGVPLLVIERSLKPIRKR